jgi:hypothetical protein
MSLTELALLDRRRPLPLGDVIGLTLTLRLVNFNQLTRLDSIIRFYQVNYLLELLYHVAVGEDTGASGSKSVRW